jgi:hypothetical protein
MSTSGTVSFALNANQIIEKAFHVLGKASEGEALVGRMYDGRPFLAEPPPQDAQHDGASVDEDGATVTLLASTAGYVLTPKPLRVLSVRRYGRHDIEIPLNEMSRQEYFDQPNKTSSPSTPVSWYYDPQSTTGTLYLWPAPATTSRASTRST